MATISNKGYTIKKKCLSQAMINIIENELNVIPEIKADYKEATSFKIYSESTELVKNKKTTYYTLPTFWALENIDTEPKYLFKIKNKDRIDIKFKGSLKYHQILCIESLLKIYYQDFTKGIIKPVAGCIISIPPGYGKTILAIYLASILKIKTLIVVHKTFLLDQWIQRISEYTNATIGIIQQNKIDINKDIVIGMLQSLNSRDYDNLDRFKLVIYDECHHLGAEVFSRVMNKLCRPYLLGLSGTVERTDKMEKVFYSYLGNIGFKIENKTEKNIIVQTYKFKTDNIKFRTLYNKFTKKYNFSKMITNITEIDERNKLIVDIVQDIINKESNRKLILLSGRIEHLHILKEMLDKIYPDNVGFYIGGMKKADLQISETKQILLASFEMAAEGLDIASLNTLLLISPKASIVQANGRIMRGDFKTIPLIIDIIDEIPIFKSMYKKRSDIYTQNYKTIFKHFKCDNNNNFKIIETNPDQEYKKVVFKNNDYLDMLNSDSSSE